MGSFSLAHQWVHAYCICRDKFCQHTPFSETNITMWILCHWHIPVQTPESNQMASQAFDLWGYKNRNLVKQWCASRKMSCAYIHLPAVQLAYLTFEKNHFYHLRYFCTAYCWRHYRRLFVGLKLFFTLSMKSLAIKTGPTRYVYLRFHTQMLSSCLVLM